MAKSLKEQNNWKIWLIVAVNVLFFWSCVKSSTIQALDLSAIAKGSIILLPAGLAGIVATVANSFIGADLKARIVFLRWHDALPGHRAFSQLALKDPRVNEAKIKSLLRGKVPNAPADQNSAWYKMYKSVEKQPSVNDAHKTFLLLRDYASLSLIFFVVFGAAGLYAIADHEVALWNLAILLAQFFIVLLSARNAGVRMVTNVLALKSA